MRFVRRFARWDVKIGVRSMPPAPVMNAAHMVCNQRHPRLEITCLRAKGHRKVHANGDHLWAIALVTLVGVLTFVAAVAAQIRTADWFALTEEARMTYAAGFLDGSAGRFGCKGRPPVPRDLAIATEQVLVEGKITTANEAIVVAAHRLGCEPLPDRRSL